MFQVIAAFDKRWCAECFQCYTCNKAISPREKFIEYDMKPICKKCFGTGLNNFLQSYSHHPRLNLILSLSRIFQWKKKVVACQNDLETELGIITWKHNKQLENITLNLESFLSIWKNNIYSERIIFNLETPFFNSKHERFQIKK